MKDLLTGTGDPGLTVKVCYATDVDCASPLSTQTTDGAGATPIDFPKDQAFFVEVTDANVPDHLIYFNGPLNDDFAWTWLVVNNADYLALGALATDGAGYDPTRGNIGLTVVDCGGQFAAGATVEVDTADGNSSIAYFAETGYPDTALSQTSGLSRVAIANVPVGTAVVTARIADTNEIISSRTVTVRAGDLTYPANLSPTPEAQ